MRIQPNSRNPFRQDFGSAITGAPKSRGLWGDAQNEINPTFCVGCGRKSWRELPVFCGACRRGAAVSRNADVAPTLRLDSYDGIGSPWREACQFNATLVGFDPDAATSSAGRVSLEDLRAAELASDAESIADGDAPAPERAEIRIRRRRIPVYSDWPSVVVLRLQTTHWHQVICIYRCRPRLLSPWQKKQYRLRVNLMIAKAAA